MSSTKLHDLPRINGLDPLSPLTFLHICLKSCFAQENGEFHWDSYTQGIILASFFYGYILTQLPGAWIAKRFGPKIPFGLSCFIAGLLSLLIPVAARSTYKALVAVRVLQGISEVSPRRLCECRHHQRSTT